MDLWKYLFSFVVGGTIVTSIIAFEESGFPLLSRLAALFPVFTWLSYLFIASVQTPSEISAHAKFVLIGTIVCWVPYMLIIIYLSPKIGVQKAVLAAIAAFIILALLFSFLYYRV